MTQDNMKTIAVSEIAFDETPAFCRNGMSFVNGKAFRFRDGTILTVPGQPDVTVEKGSVLFKDKDGRILLHTAEEFERDFSRLLKNGCHVRLSRADSVQLLEIRQAEDTKHLKDWMVSKGQDIADASMSFYGKLLASDLFMDAAIMTCDVGSGAQELGNDLRERVQAVWNAPERQELRDKVTPVAEAVKSRLKKLAWGKFGNG